MDYFDTVRRCFYHITMLQYHRHRHHNCHYYSYGPHITIKWTLALYASATFKKSLKKEPKQKQLKLGKQKKIHNLFSLFTSKKKKKWTKKWHSCSCGLKKNPPQKKRKQKKEIYLSPPSPLFQLCVSDSTFIAFSKHK